MTKSEKSRKIEPEISDSVREWLITHPEEMLGASSPPTPLAEAIDKAFGEALDRHKAAKLDPMSTTMFCYEIFAIVQV